MYKVVIMIFGTLMLLSTGCAGISQRVLPTDPVRLPVTQSTTIPVVVTSHSSETQLNPVAVTVTVLVEQVPPTVDNIPPLFEQPLDELSLTPVAHSPTKTPQPAEPASNLLSGPYLVFNNVNQELLLVDTQTGQHRRILFSNPTAFRFVGFLKNGCELAVRQGSSEVVVIDLHGQVLRELLLDGWFHAPGHLTNMVLSPNQEWLAFGVGRGQQGYDGWEYEDVLAIDLYTQTQVNLSTRAGGSVPVWSPDNAWIGFSDFDEQGIHQIFLTDPIGMGKIQVTNFGTDSAIRDMQWSPNNQFLAFTQYRTTSEVVPGLTVIQLENGQEMHILYDIGEIYNYWWETNSRVTAYVQTYDENNTELVSYDITSGQLVQRTMLAIHNESIRVVARFNAEEILVITDVGIHIINRSTLITLQKFELGTDFSEWFLSPPEFPGETQCNSN